MRMAKRPLHCRLMISATHPHYWMAATAAGENDGYLTLWLNDDKMQTKGGQNNDQQRVGDVYFGAADGIDAGTSGTIYLDDFMSRLQNFIGSNPDVVIDNGLIFADDFESGDLSAWFNSVTDGGDLSVSAAAAVEGGYGLEAVVDDTNPIYVEDASPVNDKRYRARFYVDLNGVTIPNWGQMTILTDANGVMGVDLAYGDGDYYLIAWLAKDNRPLA